MTVWHRIRVELFSIERLVGFFRLWIKWRKEFLKTIEEELKKDV